MNGINTIMFFTRNNALFILPAFTMNGAKLFDSIQDSLIINIRPEEMLNLGLGFVKSSIKIFEL